MEPLYLIFGFIYTCVVATMLLTYSDAGILDGKETARIILWPVIIIRYIIRELVLILIGR